MQDETTVQVVDGVEVQVFPPRSMFLRQGVASGKAADGEEVEVSQNLGDGTVLVRFDQGEWFAFTVESLISAAWRARADLAGGT